MTTRSVFALASGRYELFMGYTSLTSDGGRELLEDVLSRISSSRAATFATLQRMGGGSVFVFAKDLEADDPVRDTSRKNAHLFGGEPYIHDLAHADLLVGDVVVELREPDHGIPVTLATGQTVFVPGSDGTHSVGLAGGTTELI